MKENPDKLFIVVSGRTGEPKKLVQGRITAATIPDLIRHHEMLSSDRLVSFDGQTFRNVITGKRMKVTSGMFFYSMGLYRRMYGQP